MTSQSCSSSYPYPNCSLRYFMSSKVSSSWAVTSRSLKFWCLPSSLKGFPWVNKHLRFCWWVPCRIPRSQGEILQWSRWCPWWVCRRSRTSCRVRGSGRSGGDLWSRLFSFWGRSRGRRGRGTRRCARARRWGSWWWCPFRGRSWVPWLQFIFCSWIFLKQ